MAKSSSLDRIRRDIERNYATCYWNEDSLTKDGRVPKEHTIEPAKFLERVVKACMRDRNFRISALRKVQSLIGTALGQDPEDARNAIEEIERIVDKALAMGRAK